MLITIDIGNTKIKFALVVNDKIITRFCLTTSLNRSLDEYIAQIRKRLKFDIKTIDYIIISTVVGDLKKVFDQIIIRLFDKKPLIIDRATQIPIRLKSPDLQQTGSDRLINCLSANKIYGGNIAIVDFGSATTIDVVSRDKVFQGGIILPGFKAMRSSIKLSSPALPIIEVDYNSDILIASNTKSAINSGLVNGYVAMIDGLIDRIKKQQQLDYVIATGGLGKVLSNHAKYIDIYNQDLTLQGLNFCFNMQYKIFNCVNSN